MGSCCSQPKQVHVELEYLVVDGETCDRCGDTREAVRAAVADARRALPPTLATLDLVERELTAAQLPDSNRVLVNGRPAEEWLGGHAVMSDCPSCGDLVGESVCCREVEVGGIRTEAVGRDVVFDAIMAAAGLAGRTGREGLDEASAARSVREDSEEGPARPASSCCAPAPAPRAALAVTLVTGPGCG